MVPGKLQQLYPGSIVEVKAFVRESKLHDGIQMKRRSQQVQETEPEKEEDILDGFDEAFFIQ
ncbi:MAG: hypothetical protein J6B06_00505 [Lachnospiraceae bacterium]|nr:hypothetical protein [Lachnospiraceae bacterium]